MKQFGLILAFMGIVGWARAAYPTAGLQLHLDVDSLSGYVDGDTVSTWPDLAGGDHNATSTGTPTYVADGLNGRPVIRIDGTSDRDGNGLPNSYDFYSFPTVSNVKTIAFVFKPTSNTYYTWSTIVSGPTNDNYYWHGDTQFGNAYWDWVYTVNSIAQSDLAIDGEGGFDGGWTAVDYDSFRVITVDLYDGDQVDLGFLAHTARYNDTNVYGMEIAELLVYDQHLSAAELEELHFELALKYDLWAAKPLHPKDGQTNVPVNDDLSWQAYEPSWGVDVYFDPNQTNVAAGDASVKIVSNQAVSTIDPGTMDDMTAYYWRVDLYEPNTLGVGYILHEGPVWSFETLPPDPLITTHPISQTVDAGSSVALSIAGQNLETYQWYLNDLPVAGATNPTLSIASLGIADEGVYTCVASNPSGSVSSTPAIVVSKRLMGWWKLDGDLTDSVTLEVPGALAHDGSIDDPNFNTGVDGAAYEFFQDSRVITIADSQDYFNFYPNGLTLSAWVNTAQSGWGGLVSKINSAGDAGFYLEHESDNWLVSGIRGIDGQWSAAEGIYNSWQLLTLTLDGTAKTVKQYVNGELTAEADYTVDLPLSPGDLFFGAERADGSFALVGLLDDVKIWSYPLDNIAVAHLYADITGNEVCSEYVIFDVTGPADVPDCRVDLYDFAAAAAMWLDCNLVPTCID